MASPPAAPGPSPRSFGVAQAAPTDASFEDTIVTLAEEALHSHYRGISAVTAKLVSEAAERTGHRLAQPAETIASHGLKSPRTRASCQAADRVRPAVGDFADEGTHADEPQLHGGVAVVTVCRSSGAPRAVWTGVGAAPAVRADAGPRRCGR